MRPKLFGATDAQNIDPMIKPLLCTSPVSLSDVTGYTVSLAGFAVMSGYDVIFYPYYPGPYRISFIQRPRGTGAVPKSLLLV